MSFKPARLVLRDLAAIWAPLVLIATPTTANAQCLEEHLFASNSGQDYHFGQAVAISGDTGVVGVPGEDMPEGYNAGAVYVYVRSAGIWTLQARLIASDAFQDQRFGSSVSISGDMLAVGAPVNGFAQQAVYIFERSGGVWTQQARLAPSDGIAGRFGFNSIALSGDTVLVGAFEDRSAYVFVRSGGVWTEQQQLLPSDDGEYFGWSVALSGETAVVGARWQNNAHVFVRTGSIWTQQARLTGSDSIVGDTFGDSVAISGDTVVVGASGDNTAGGIDAGSAYVFVRNGGVWTEQAHLFASDARAGDGLGWSAAFSDD